VEANGHATEECAAIGAGERLEEMVMMGLRLAEGVTRERFRRETGRTLEQALDGTALADLAEGGFLVIDRHGMRATEAGRQRLNAVLARLLA
jgi:coproporphyrinogen III oxidase-like Fe-S oxidoreductase